MCTVLLDEWWEAMMRLTEEEEEEEDNDGVSRERRGSVGVH